MKVIKEKKRIEGGKEIIYRMYNESYEDDYGAWVSDYTVYRLEDGVETRISPVVYNLSQIEADSYMTFHKWKRCEHCGISRYEWEE